MKRPSRLLLLIGPIIVVFTYAPIAVFLMGNVAKQYSELLFYRAAGWVVQHTRAKSYSNRRYKSE